jgi:hypothetical protein
MNFIAPGAFLLALAVPVIIALYFLKLRRSEREVSSTFLWARMVRDIEANAPWQRLRRNLLLLLQILFLITLIFAAARPFNWKEGFGGESVILIIDTSISMAAHDLEPNRLEAAKELAHNLVNNFPNTTRLTILEASNKPIILLSSSHDRHLAHQKIDQLKISTTTSDLEIALQLASAIAANQQNIEIILLSDGNGILPENMSLKGNFNYIPIGSSAENQAISVISIDRSQAGINSTVFVQITNYGKKTANRRLAIYVNEQIFDTYDLILPPGEISPLLVEDIPSDIQSIRVQFMDSTDETHNQEVDVFPPDDRAYAILRDEDKVKVKLISDGNLFLATALSLLPGIELTKARLSQIDNEIEKDDSLIVVDGYAQSIDLPPGNIFFVGPVQSTEFFTITGTIQNPYPVNVPSDLPIMNNVNMDDINILEAARISLPRWAETAIFAKDTLSGTSNQMPLLFFGEKGTQRIAVLAFDLHQSDFPLHISFPILIANIIEYLEPGSGSRIPTQYAPGETLIMPILSSQSTPVIITKPNGESTIIETRDGQITFADTYQLGIYKIQFDDQTIEFAVNLQSPLESNIAPILNLPPDTFNREISNSSQQATRQEWWRQLVILALSVLVIEWFVYLRASISRVIAYISKVLKQN